MSFETSQRTTGSTTQSSSVRKRGGNERRRRLQSDFDLFLPAKNALVFQQYELHDLVLIDHVHGDVARLRLGPQQRGSKHDGHTLGGHAVRFPVFDHPGEDKMWKSPSSTILNSYFIYSFQTWVVTLGIELIWVKIKSLDTVSVAYWRS